MGGVGLGLFLIYSISILVHFVFSVWAVCDDVMSYFYFHINKDSKIDS